MISGWEVGEPAGRPTLVEWRSVAEPIAEYEIAYLDALDVLREDEGTPTVDVIGKPLVQPDVIVLAYRASLGSDPRISTAIAEACLRHRGPPARLIVAACGLSDAEVAEPAGTGCEQHYWQRATSVEALHEAVLMSVRATSRRIAAMRLPVEVPVVDQNSPPRTGTRHAKRWPRWRA